VTRLRSMFSSTKRQYASEVVANPPGTRTPFAASCRIISPSDAFFPPTTFQVSNIHAGTGAQNITPGAMQVDFNFRFSTESTPESLKSRVVEILERHGLEYDLAWTLGGKPFLTQKGRLVTTLVNAIRKVTGVTAEVNCQGGTSDGRFIIDVCGEVAEFGPVNRSIHKVNEAVALDEIEPLADVYRTAIEDLLLAR